jgi:SET domain-containing protein
MTDSLKKPPIHPLVCPKASGIHKRGVFAKKFISKGARIIEYTGQKITKAQSAILYEKTLKNSKMKGTGAVYIFELNQRYDINGDVPYNLAKYINHACETNCYTENIRGHIWIVAQRDIQKGEEILYDYGYALDHWQDHKCLCAKPSCVGYIVAQENRSKLLKKLKALGM